MTTASAGAKTFSEQDLLRRTIERRAVEAVIWGMPAVNYGLMNAPVRLYWSATAYDRATHALIREQEWASRASTTPGLQKNSDGSVDVFFGPTAPAGKESNWVPTGAGGQFEVLFRLYGPEKPLFDKSWRLPDIERVAS